MDLTQCSSDSEDGGEARQTEEIVLTHVKNESVLLQRQHSCEDMSDAWQIMYFCSS